jgi:superfamily I DNA/RNA helicase
VIKAGLPFNLPQNQEEQHAFWTVKAATLFSEALDRLPEGVMERYDAVLVDEAQDFHQDWWFPVQLMLRDPDKGRLCLFSDPEQTGVYSRGDAFPRGLVSFELLENCRNTQRIAEYCSRILDSHVPPYSNSPVGITPKIFEPTPDARKRAELVRRIVVELMNQQFASSRIAILSPWRRSAPGSALFYMRAVYNMPFRGEEDDVPAWVAGKIIWASTIKSFKGLEADCVILADAPFPNLPGFSLADLYVAVSRAKHRLFIVPTSTEAVAELLRWAATIE